MKIHFLKSLPVYFTARWELRKSAEIRRDDRDYQVGDVLVEQEIDSEKGNYTGRQLRSFITHTLRNTPGYGLKDGFVILSTTQPLRTSCQQEVCDCCSH